MGRKMARNCNYPAPRPGGKGCLGIAIQEQTCNNISCRCCIGGCPEFYLTQIITKIDTNEKYSDRCGNDTWFGLNDGYGVHIAKVAKISLKVSGNARLVFANCYHLGTVTAYLNGNTLGHAKGDEFKTVSFTFEKGDTLKIEMDF